MMFWLPFLDILYFCFILFIAFLFLFLRDTDSRKSKLYPFCVPIHKKNNIFKDFNLQNICIFLLNYWRIFFILFTPLLTNFDLLWEFNIFTLKCILHLMKNCITSSGTSIDNSLNISINLVIPLTPAFNCASWKDLKELFHFPKIVEKLRTGSIQHFPPYSENPVVVCAFIIWES